MARPIRTYPVPKIYKRGKAIRIRWYANEEHFEFSLGCTPKTVAETIRTAMEAAFAGRAEYPEEVAHEPAIKRYIAITNNLEKDTDEQRITREYLNHIKSKCQSSWPANVRTHLQKALDHCETILHATPKQLMQFLDAEALRNSPATRNRAQAALSGFFRYCRNAGYLPKHYNPLDGIKQAREERPPDGIVVWEPAEVKQLLQAADGRKDGIAVWIAILAGLRRGEIARLRKEEITDAYIIVGKSKTGVKRQVPLSAALAKRLQSETGRDGRIVPWPENQNGWEIAARRLVTEHLPKALPAVYDAHPEKFGWNPFRHTFASRHAQAGLSLDIIAAWLGDSPKVCKEHYARYVPRNLRDTRIDAADPEI